MNSNNTNQRQRQEQKRQQGKNKCKNKDKNLDNTSRLIEAPAGMLSANFIRGIEFFRNLFNP